MSSAEQVDEAAQRSTHSVRSRASKQQTTTKQCAGSNAPSHAHLSLLQNNDAVGIHDGGQPMGHYQHCAV